MLGREAKTSMAGVQAGLAELTGFLITVGITESVENMYRVSGPEMVVVRGQ